MKSEVVVARVALSTVAKSEVEVAPVALKFVAKRLVEVELVVVPVAAVKLVPLKLVAKRLVDVAFVVVPVVTVKLVATPVVTKRFVVVACDVVAFTPVKFWSVVEPVARMLADEMRLEAERAVVEAYGRTDAVVPVAIKVFPVTFPAKIAEEDANTWSLNHTGIVVEGVSVRVL